MGQNYTIFADTRCLEIIQKEGQQIKVSINGMEKTFPRIDEFKKQLLQFVDDFESSKTDKLKLVGNDTSQLFELVKGCYDKFILAAGGLVQNSGGEVLLIFRNGKWDLPKGKAEEGESIEVTAVREVQEETGLSELKVISKLPNTYHTYSLKGKRVLKETHWYWMQGNGDLKPQQEEGITEVVWMQSADLQKVFSNTYENVKMVLRKLL